MTLPAVRPLAFPAAPPAPDDPAERLLRTVLGPLASVAVRLDAAGVVTYVNDAFLAVTGWARSEVVGAEWGDGFAPAGCPGHAVVRAGLAGVPGRGDGELFTRAGERRLVAWDVVPVPGPGGRPAGAVCMGLDVTEDRRVARERARLARELAAQADHDPVTGLLNARGFARVSAHAGRVAARTHRLDAVLAVRLQALPAAYAEHGPAVADDAVCDAAEALRGVVRDSDLVARVADDVFVVYAVGTGAPEHGASAARRVRAALAAADARARDAGRAFDLGCAVGVAERRAGEDLESLLARALDGADAAAAEAAAAPSGGEGWLPDDAAWRGW